MFQSNDVILWVFSLFLIFLGVRVFWFSGYGAAGFAFMSKARGKWNGMKKSGKGLLVLTLLMLVPAFLSGEKVGMVTKTVAMPAIASGSPQEVKSKPETLKSDMILDDMEVHFIDAGQSNAALVICGGRTMLIDAGGNSKGTAIQLYLEKQKIKKLDYVIGSHPDEDHIGGLDVIISKFDCGRIIMPEYSVDTATYRDVISAMEYKAYKNTKPVPGDSYKLGDAQFTIIAPNKEYGNDTNNWSVGILLTHGDKKFLFTGDAEEEAEKDMVKHGIDIKCDVYQAGHHGSKTSSTEALLDAAAPLFAVISCGEDNEYGHPGAQTLNRFRTRGIKVFRTDEQGTIIAVSDGDVIHWNCAPSLTWKAGEPKAAKSGGKIAAAGKIPKAGAQKEEITYVLNIKSMKFHKLTCTTLPTSNRKDTDMSREAVISQGYQPCKRCKP